MSKQAMLYPRANNVRAVISDVEIPWEYTGHVPQNFITDLVTVNNYYPFGMQMPGRTYNSPSYRYGFQGQEKDDEVKGSGNSLDFGARVYDSRLGRWLSVDGFAAIYSTWTPYVFAGDNPILNIDKDGNYWVVSTGLVSSPDRGVMISVTSARSIEKLDKYSILPFVDKILLAPKIIASVNDPSYSLSTSDAITLIFSGIIGSARKALDKIAKLTVLEKTLLGAGPGTVDLLSRVLSSSYPQLVVENTAVYRLQDKGIGWVSTDPESGHVIGLNINPEILGKLRQNAISDLGLSSQAEVDLNIDLIEQKVFNSVQRIMDAEINEVQKELENVAKEINSLDEDSE